MPEVEASPGLTGHLDRRAVLAKIAAGGALVAAPQIVSTPAFALASCCKRETSKLLTGCQDQVTISTVTCRTVLTASTTICRRQPTTPMRLSRNAAGNQEPYFDELGVLTVTSPTNVVLRRNFVRFQNDCRVSSIFADYALTSNTPCGTTGVGAVDVSNLFNNECGVFTVQLEVRNYSTPYAWSSAYIVAF